MRITGKSPGGAEVISHLKRLKYRQLTVNNVLTWNLGNLSENIVTVLMVNIKSTETIFTK